LKFFFAVKKFCWKNFCHFKNQSLFLEVSIFSSEEFISFVPSFQIFSYSKISQKKKMFWRNAKKRGARGFQNFLDNKSNL